MEAVLSAHRVKLFVKKENVMLMFALGGVRAPGRSKAGVDEPFAPEALSFMRRLALQVSARPPAAPEASLVSTYRKVGTGKHEGETSTLCAAVTCMS